MVFVKDGTTDRPVRYIPSAANFDPASLPPMCTVPLAPPAEPIALGIGATYLSSCAQTPGATLRRRRVRRARAGLRLHHTQEQRPGRDHGRGRLPRLRLHRGWRRSRSVVVQNLRFKRGPTASTTPHDGVGDPPSSLADEDGDPRLRDVGGAHHRGREQPEPRGHARDPRNGALRSAPRGHQAPRLQGVRPAVRLLPRLDERQLRQADVRDGHYLPWSPRRTSRRSRRVRRR